MEDELTGNDVATMMGEMNCTRLFDAQGNVLDLGVSAKIQQALAGRA